VTGAPCAPSLSRVGPREQRSRVRASRGYWCSRADDLAFRGPLTARRVSRRGLAFAELREARILLASHGVEKAFWTLKALFYSSKELVPETQNGVKKILPTALRAVLVFAARSGTHVTTRDYNDGPPAPAWIASMMMVRRGCAWQGSTERGLWPPAVAPTTSLRWMWTHGRQMK
jgi:hypothetical protein